MTQHFTRYDVSAAFFCRKCGKQTQHRIDHEPTGAGRKGPCLECIARLDQLHDVALKAEPEKQGSLFS